MARRDVERQRHVAQLELHPIGRDDIFPGLQLRRLVALRHDVPVGFGHDEARAVRILEELRSEITIPVGVTKDYIPDVGRVEAERLQPVRQFLDAVVVAGIDNDNAFRCRDCPY